MTDRTLREEREEREARYLRLGCLSILLSFILMLGVATVLWWLLGQDA